MKDIINLFGSPKIIGIVADVNNGKSNLLYDIIIELKENKAFNLYTYGLRNDLGDVEQKIYSIQELEMIKNSVIICDEFFTLFDLDNRKKKRMIENTLRLIHHNNNILVLVGLPENFKKFISAKIEIVFFKKCTLADFIQGSKIKDTVMSYKGAELGSTVLNINIDDTLIFDGKHYHIDKVKYHKNFDTKRDNEPILKECATRGKKSVPNIVQKKI